MNPHITPFRFLPSGGAAGTHIRGMNWEETALGTPERWPLALKIALANMLSSQIAACLCWGPDRLLFYNDGYKAILGDKPEAMGRPIEAVWAEVWADIGPIVDKAYAGAATFIENYPLRIDRHGFFEQAYFTFCYSPLFDETGTVQGMLDTVLETTDAVLAAEATRQASERIGLALDSGTVIGTWVWDISQDHFTGDERFARTFSLDAGLLQQGLRLGQVVQSIHPDDLDRVNALIGEAMSRGGAYCAQYRVRMGEKWRWIEANGRVELDEKGEASRFPGVLIDIDQRKQVELKLQGAQEQLELAQIAGGIGIFAIAHGENDVIASPEFCRIFGVPVRFVIPSPELEALCLPEDRPLQSNVQSRNDASAALDVVYRIRRADDGAIRWIARRAQFVRDEAGELQQMIGIVQDVTDRRRAEVDLMESQAHLALMVESAQEYAIISVSAEGVITSWNQGAERVFGGTTEEMTGQPFSIIFTPEDRDAGIAERELATAAHEGRSLDQRWHQRTDRARFYANGITSAMYDRNGGLTGFTKIARDMTAERLAHDNLLRAKEAAEVANVAKSEFLANMSHEIRTPMNAIIGLSTLLSMSRPLTPRQSEFLKTLQSSADSLLGLINDLLDISKIEARSIELESIPFNLTNIIQDVASMMAVRIREKGLNFRGEGDCIEARSFVGDPTRIRQIIVNLCSNAIKFTDQGEVAVDIQCTPLAEPGLEQVCIAISDTGVGIPEDKIDSVFNKFTQADSSISRRFGGTGLGLAITRTLTELMGGTIRVTSELGRGSTFTVCLPLQIASQSEHIETSGRVAEMIAQSVSARPKARILLVEDYEPNIIVAEAFLEEFGYEVDVATNGLQAVDMVRTGRYSGVLMDVQMHDLNGLEATQMIRAFEVNTETRRVPIIGMTAHALAGDRERCIAAGMDDYIAKPFNPQLLKALLDQYAR